MKYILFFCLTLYINLSHGQVFKNFGFKAGINYTQFEWEIRVNSTFPVESLESERTIGYNYFITSDLVSKKRWDVNSSLGFVQKNGTASYHMMHSQGTHYELRVPYKLNYVSFINVVRGKLLVNNSFFVTGQLGPRLEYLINPSDHLETFAPYGGAFFYYYEKGDIQRLNIGLSGSLGFLLNLKNVKFGLEVWKNINFNPITSAKGPRLDGLGDEGFYLKMRDKTYLLNLLFIFNL